ncbi:MAG: hypothetical protein QNL62_18270 [Gammaproteobacteria bacterium]|nr:hypothetical protein [Gammaproteobacteria bacterium]
MFDKLSLDKQALVKGTLYQATQHPLNAKKLLENTRNNIKDADPNKRDAQIALLVSIHSAFLTDSFEH